MAEETDRSTSPEPAPKPENNDSPLNAFAKDQLKGISFLVPDSDKRVTLERRLGKMYPRYEALVLAHLDILNNRIGSKHEEDAKKRAEVIYRDWQNEYHKEKSSHGIGIVGRVDDAEYAFTGDVEEDARINYDQPTRDASVFKSAYEPANIMIDKDDYSSDSSS